MGNARPFDVADASPLSTSAAHQADATSKLLGLELLRFFAALAVLFYHYRHFAHMSGVEPILRTDVPYHWLLWPMYEYGQFGVQLFWGISGYIFFWKYGSQIHEAKVGAKKFFWLRFSRLYPLHLATLALVIVLQTAHRQVAGFDFIYPAQDGGALIRQLFLATHWGSHVPFTFNGPIWSISAEVVVYAGFYLLIRKLAPSIARCAAIVAGSLVLRLAGIDLVPIACASYFFAGGVAALAPKRFNIAAGVAFAFLLTVCGVTGILGDRGKLSIILLLAVPLLLMFASREWRGLARFSRPIRAAGNLTYSSYLLHFPIQLLLAIASAGGFIEVDLTSPLILALYLGATLLAAAISYRMFELPAQEWLRRRTIARRPRTAYAA